MNIRHLRIFKAVYDTGSITKAAEALFITQPAVSHAISELETQLKTTLFDRISRRLYITETGKLYYEKVQTILELYDELENGHAIAEETAVLRIGSSITIANFWLPHLMREFHHIHPQTPVRIEVASAQAVKTMLHKHDIDLGFVEGIIHDESLCARPFSSYCLAVFCAPNHHWTEKEVVTLKELCAENLLLRERGSAIRDVLDSALMLHHLSCEPTWTSVNSQALIQAAKANLGVTVLPEILVRHELESGELKKITLQETALINENHIVFQKNKFLTGSMQNLINLAEKLHFSVL